MQSRRVRRGLGRVASSCTGLFLAASTALSGCSINPNTGRSQIIAIPSAQMLHADTVFNIESAAQGLVASVRCVVAPNKLPGNDDGKAQTNNVSSVEPIPLCPSTAQIKKFHAQVQRIGAELEITAQALDPDLQGRIGDFNTVVADIPGDGVGSASSAGGRIHLSSSLAATDPTDDMVAFLLAREMGHVIARHGEEDSGARLAFSALSTVMPIGGLIVRFAASLLGSQVLKASWAEAQRSEADMLAITLLERCNRTPAMVALNLRVGLNYARLVPGEWATQLAASTSRVIALTQIRS